MLERVRELNPHAMARPLDKEFWDGDVELQIILRRNCHEELYSMVAWWRCLTLEQRTTEEENDTTAKPTYAIVELGHRTPAWRGHARRCRARARSAATASDAMSLGLPSRIEAASTIAELGPPTSSTGDEVMVNMRAGEVEGWKEGRKKTNREKRTLYS